MKHSQERKLILFETMKRRRKEIPFLEQIEKVPNVSLACQMVGIARNTIYRWCNEDEAFKERFDEAMSKGSDSIADLAEGKLIEKIKGGNMPAIKYWLDNNNKRYIKPRQKEPQSTFTPVTHIVISDADKRTITTETEEEKED